jgi:hypothetical protein
MYGWEIETPFVRLNRPDSSKCLRFLHFSSACNSRNNHTTDKWWPVLEFTALPVVYHTLYLGHFIDDWFCHKFCLNVRVSVRLLQIPIVNVRVLVRFHQWLLSVYKFYFYVKHWPNCSLLTWQKLFAQSSTTPYHDFKSRDPVSHDSSIAYPIFPQIIQEMDIIMKLFSDNYQITIL